jgi:hypothetical protein
VGQTRTVEGIDGRPMTYTIEDEILHPQSGLPEKLICFQRLRFEDGTREVRLAYYMLGARNYWVWGQYATMVPSPDFSAIVAKAQSAGWFKAEG